MKHFCPICGKPTIYNLSLPKFCSSCGNAFSLVTKEQDKSPQDQAVEKLKEKYPINTPPSVPINKPEPKKFPNPARASFRIVNENDHEYYGEDGDDYGDEIDANIDIYKLKNIKPKFTLQNVHKSSESFENMLTQSYASNYQSANLSDTRPADDMPARNTQSILEEFKREAGSSRNRQE